MEIHNGLMRRACLLLLAALFAGGCYQRIENQPGRTQVTGQVLWNGAPLPMGSITFISAADPQMRATGLIHPDGSFRFSDVPLGAMQVAVETASARFGLPPDQAGQFVEIPARYADVRTSGLTAQIVAEGPSLEIVLHENSTTRGERP